MSDQPFKTGVFLAMILAWPRVAQAAPSPKTGAPKPTAQPAAHKAEELNPAYPDIPRNHWAYVAVGKLERGRLTPPMRKVSGLAAPVVLTRYEFAVATARASDALSQVPRMETLHLNSMSWKQIENEIAVRMWLSQFHDAIAALQAEFAPELERLRVRGGLETRVPSASIRIKPHRAPGFGRTSPGAIEFGDK